MTALILGALLVGSAFAAPASKPLATRDTISLTCANNANNGTIYTTTTGYWEIICGVDYAGGDTTTTTTVDTFEDCIAACENQVGCVDVSYTGTTCYLKDELNTVPSTNADVWTARSVTYADTFTCTADGTYFTATNNGTYLIKCGVDHAGGDFASQNTISFAACIDLCDSTSGCIDVSYVAPACYLKSTLEPAVTVSHVWTAQKVDGHASTNPFTIISAYYADRDVTVAAQAHFLSGSKMIIDTSSLVTAMGGDPWVGTEKTLVVLYEYNGQQRVFVALDNTGVYTTVAGALTSANAPGSSALYSYDKMVSVTWGPEQLTLDSALKAVDSQYTTNWGFQIEDLFFAIDTKFGLQKSAVFYYYGDDGSLKSLAGKEHSWVKLLH